MDSLWRSMLSEWKVAVALALIALAAIIVAGSRSSTPALLQVASVVRFGSYANEIGNHPTVIVRLQDGSTQEMRSTPVLLRACSVGATIHLVRRARSLQVDSRGCL
jgi:hypothetical protein